ncbi:MAG: cupin domain-containing protein [Candidatus Anstonellales archaeon]
MLKLGYIQLNDFQTDIVKFRLSNYRIELRRYCKNCSDIMHYHIQSPETIYIISGSGKLIYNINNRTNELNFSEGEYIRVYAKTLHSIYVDTDSVILTIQENIDRIDHNEDYSARGLIPFKSNIKNPISFRNTKIKLSIYRIQDYELQKQSPDLKNYYLIIVGMSKFKYSGKWYDRGILVINRDNMKDLENLPDHGAILKISSKLLNLIFLDPS